MRNFKQLSHGEKVSFTISFFIRILLIIAILLGIWEANWMAVFVSVMAFSLTFLPYLISWRYRIILPIEIQTIIISFIYASIFLGEVRGYYTRLWWWDSLLHLLSGIALGFVGFLILYILNQKGKIAAGPGVIVLFSFCFALALGALWEIFEFAMDVLFNLDMQKSRNLEMVYGYCDTRFGLIDTMYDLILDAVGALFASIVGYFYLIRGKSFFVDFWLKRIKEKNPELFNS